MTVPSHTHARTCAIELPERTTTTAVARRKVTPPASTLNWADCMATFRPMGAVSKFMTDPMGEMSSKFAKT
jgi:hypothetical protein